jgi:hypothetical protein
MNQKHLKQRSHANSWFVGNWWMHDSLHMHNGMNMHGLLFIETVFQITMLICGVTMALSLVRLAPHSGSRMDASEQKPVQAAE